MKRTKDQRELGEVLMVAREARDIAYDLFARRLDTQRNVNSFILLRDAVVQMKSACKLLEEAVTQATETKSSDQLSVMDEIGVRSGKVIIVEEPESKRRPGGGSAEVLPFPTRNTRDEKKGE